MSGTLIDLINYLVNTIVFPLNNLMLYFFYQYNWYLYPPYPPSHCIPHLCILESQQY